MNPFSSWLRGTAYTGEFLGSGGPAPVDFTPAAPRSTAPALLCLHGFGCVPQEVEPLSSIGIGLNLRTRAPVLPGHGTHARDLAKTRYQDWFNFAEQTFLELVKQCGGVIVGGQSMGALLALDLASRYTGETRGVVAYANAITLGSPFPAWPLRWLSRINAPNSALERLMLPKLTGPNLADEAARHAHLTYSAQPILAAASLQRAGDRVRGQLAAIQCPVFLAHGALDATTPLENAFTVAQALQVHDVEVHVFPRSAHILTKDSDRAQVAQRSAAFIERLVL